MSHSVYCELLPFSVDAILHCAVSGVTFLPSVCHCGVPPPSPWLHHRFSVFPGLVSGYYWICVFTYTSQVSMHDNNFTIIISACWGPIVGFLGLDHTTQKAEFPDFMCLKISNFLHVPKRCLVHGIGQGAISGYFMKRKEILPCPIPGRYLKCTGNLEISMEASTSWNSTFGPVLARDDCRRAFPFVLA